MIPVRPKSWDVQRDSGILQGTVDETSRKPFLLSLHEAHQAPVLWVVRPEEEGAPPKKGTQGKNSQMGPPCHLLHSNMDSVDRAP